MHLSTILLLSAVNFIYRALPVSPLHYQENLCEADIFSICISSATPAASCVTRGCTEEQ